MTAGVGLAGCGRMGLPMLLALRDAGVDARGLDVLPPAAFGKSAAFVTDDAGAFAQGLNTLFVVVRNADQVDALLFGEQDMLRRAAGLRLLVLCSTLSPRYVRGLRDRVPPGLRLVDAPMSGAQHAARNRTLSFMLGGSAADLDQLQPLLDALGRHFHRMGPYGAGMTAKVLNNLLAASNTAMTRLVLDWADAQGLDERALLDLIGTSSGQNWLASGFDEIEFARDGHAPDNTIAILAKDVAAALDAAPVGAATALPEAVRAAILALSPRPQRG